MTPEEVVRAHLEAVSTLDIDQIMAHFAEDATFMPAIGGPTTSGIAALRELIEGFLKVMTKCDIEIVNLAVAGDVVLTERVDRLIHRRNTSRRAGHGRVRSLRGTGSRRGGTTSTWRRSDARLSRSPG